MSIRKKVKIHSKVVLDNPAESALYYYFRVIDGEGSGWVRCGWTGLSRAFGQPKPSLKRILSQGKEKGFFQEVESHRDFVFVKLSSIRKLKERSNGVHSAGMVSPEVLTDRRSLKRVAYQIALLRQQSDSEYRITQNKTNSKNIFYPELMARSTVANGCCHQNGDTYFLKSRMNAPSASQITVAMYLDKSRRTVVRWADEIPHAHMYKRVKLSDPVPQHHIRCYQVCSNGQKRRIQYRRLPNYYYPEIEPKREERQTHRIPEDPRVGRDQQADKKDLEAKLEIRKSPNTGFYQKLNALGKSLAAILTCDFLTYLCQEEVNFPLTWSFEELVEVYKDLIPTLTLSDKLTLYYYTLKYCEMEEIVPSEDSLETFFQPVAIFGSEYHDARSELPAKGKEKEKGSNFIQKLDCLTIKQLRDLCFDFTLIVKGFEKTDFYEASRSTLITALRQIVPTLSLVNQQWLMKLTRRAYKGLIPATSQMKKGLVSFSGELDETELKSFFKGLL